MTASVKRRELLQIMEITLEKCLLQVLGLFYCGAIHIRFIYKIFSWNEKLNVFMGAAMLLSHLTGLYARAACFRTLIIYFLSVMLLKLLTFIYQMVATSEAGMLPAVRQYLHN